MDWDDLVAAATAARERAYAPYSGFRVGAALRCADGTVVAGCNVENRSYGLAVCAERTAVAAAVAGGRRDFVAAVVVTDAAPPAPPCGLCRETLAEFCDDLPILLVSTSGERIEERLATLLPRRFVFAPPAR